MAGGSAFLLPGLDLDALELDLDGFGLALAVLLVVTHEGRRLDAHPQGIGAVSRDRPVTAIVVELGMPEEGLLVGADLRAIAVDEGRVDGEAGNEAVVGSIEDGHLDVSVLRRWLGRF